MKNVRSAIAQEGSVMQSMLLTPASARWYRRAALAGGLFVAQLVWTLFLLGAAVAKIFEFGAFQYTRHYTNWSWTLQMLFFAATLGAPFVQLGFAPPRSGLGQWTTTILVLAFFPLLGVVTTVALLVWVLLGTNSPFITDIFERVPPQIVILGNDLYHMIPVFSLLVFLLVYKKLIYFAVNRAAADSNMARSVARLTTFIAYESLLGAGISLAIYALIFDAQEVYETQLSVGAGIVLGFFSILASSGVPFLIVAALVGVVQETRYTDAWLLRNHYDPYEVQEYEQARGADERGKVK